MRRRRDLVGCYILEVLFILGGVLVSAAIGLNASRAVPPQWLGHVSFLTALLGLILCAQAVVVMRILSRRALRRLAAIHTDLGTDSAAASEPWTTPTDAAGRPIELPVLALVVNRLPEGWDTRVLHCAEEFSGPQAAAVLRVLANEVEVEAPNPTTEPIDETHKVN